MKKKIRIPIPPELAAEILFLADRTCCVCRISDRPVQIHHIDDNPSNNNPENLAVLCTLCHDLTQIKGGFGRKLNLDQVRLYRDEWNQIVQARKNSLPQSRGGNGGQVFIFSRSLNGNGVIDISGGDGPVGGDAGQAHIEAAANNFTGTILAKGGKSTS